MFKSKRRVFFQKSAKVFRKSLRPAVLRKHVSDDAVKIGKKSRFLFVIFFMGLIFFLTSVLLYNFQDMLPHIILNTDQIIRPNESKKGITEVESALRQERIQFESITQASESPSFIIKLPNESYAYFSATENAVSQAKLLSSILSHIAIESTHKKLKYVDLRFEKAVIKF